MEPLWKQFPDIPWGSLGWRMGWGEKYEAEWSIWYGARSEAEREVYRSRNPEPTEWAGFYAFVDHGTTPPWVVTMREEEQQAGRPPQPGEEVISEFPRIRWLLKNHLSRPKVQIEALDDTFESLYVDPAGFVWGIAHNASALGPVLRRYKGYLRGGDNLEVKQPISI